MPILSTCWLCLFFPYATEVECYDWTSDNRNPKLMNADSGRINSIELLEAGWKYPPRMECTNLADLVVKEKVIIQLFKNLNLPYHACMNENLGGGASFKSQHPDGVVYGVYLSYNAGGVHPFIINPERVLRSFTTGFTNLQHLLATSSYIVGNLHIDGFRSLEALLLQFSRGGFISEWSGSSGQETTSAE